MGKNNQRENSQQNRKVPMREEIMNFRDDVAIRAFFINFYPFYQLSDYQNQECQVFQATCPECSHKLSWFRPNNPQGTYQLLDYDRHQQSHKMPKRVRHIAKKACSQKKSKNKDNSKRKIFATQSISENSQNDSNQNNTNGRRDKMYKNKKRFYSQQENYIHINRNRQRRQDERVDQSEQDTSQNNQAKELITSMILTNIKGHLDKFWREKIKSCRYYFKTFKCTAEAVEENFYKEQQLDMVIDFLNFTFSRCYGERQIYKPTRAVLNQQNSSQSYEPNSIE